MDVVGTFLDSELYTHTHTHTHTRRVTIFCHITDLFHIDGHDRTIFEILVKYCTRLLDDGSSVIRNFLEYF